MRAVVIDARAVSINPLEAAEARRRRLEDDPNVVGKVILDPTIPV